MTTELDGMLRRLNLPTVRRLWSELQVRVEQESLGYAAYLETLMGEEIAHRGQTRIRRVTRAERFPFLRTVEEFDFAFQSGLRKELLGSYLGPEFVSEGRSLIAYGPSGTGKTHVAVAIAYKAIQNGSDARFVTASHLLDELSSASREGGLREALSAYTHPGVLVVDEVGYLSLGPDAANVLFQVVKDRYLHRRPMVFTTNKPIEAWGKVLHDGDLAEAILDRVLERGRVLHFKGPSFRTRHLPTKEGAIISGKEVPEFQERTRALGTCQKWLLRTRLRTHTISPKGPSVLTHLLRFRHIDDAQLCWSLSALNPLFSV
ncbi:MAG: IS21-like element helper ATPase IstB [Nitrososphaerota archaeon]|nr:IS21-like element helper ATPase IstB [Nitrososphaerota archaeon]